MSSTSTPSSTCPTGPAQPCMPCGTAWSGRTRRTASEINGTGARTDGGSGPRSAVAPAGSGTPRGQPGPPARDGTTVGRVFGAEHAGQSRLLVTDYERHHRGGDEDGVPE